MKYRNYLQHHRRQVNLSQFNLARKIGGGVSRIIVSNWETGVSMPTRAQMKIISKILKIDSKTLFPEKVDDGGNSEIKTLNIHKKEKNDSRGEA
jgi:transcriptional regulator with XRE-family HTH domain